MFLRALWRNVVHRRRVESDLDEEMRATLDTLVSERIKIGATPADAKRAATLALGGVEQLKEHVRDVRVGVFLESVLRDFGFAIRTFRRDPSTAAVAILILGIGIGVNNTMFSIVNALVLRGLPLDHPDRVVFVTTRDVFGREQGVSPADFADFKTDAAGVVDLAAFSTESVAVGDEGQAPERRQVAYVSQATFRLIGEQPSLGRDFRPDDDVTGAANVALLGSDLWRMRYHSDRAIVGRTIRINGTPTVVIGIMREGLKFPATTDLWEPMASLTGPRPPSRQSRTLGVFGRLAADATIAQARGRIESTGARLSGAFPATNKGLQPYVVPINEHYSNGGLSNPAWLAFTMAGGLIVLIACANVANLLLAQSHGRSREIAIRVSLGATRQRVIRQLLVEAAALAVAGAVAGLGISEVATRLFESAIPANTLPYWVNYSMDGRVLGVLSAVCLGTLFIFGLVPAIHTAKTDVAHVLKGESSQLAGSAGLRRWTAAFLVVEISLTLVFVAFVGMGIRLNRERQRAEGRIDGSTLLTTWLTLPPNRYPTAAARLAFYDKLDTDLKTHGADPLVTIASALPDGGAATRTLSIAGRASTSLDPSQTVSLLTVGARYFETIGLSSVRGRTFTQDDGLPGHESVIINQRLADLFFPNQDPIGQRLILHTPPASDAAAPELTIVGVSPNIRQRFASIDLDPVAYVPHRMNPPVTAVLIMRITKDPELTTSLLRTRVTALDPDLPLYRTMTMDAARKMAGWNARVSSVIVYVLSAIALMMAVVGLSTVTAHVVSLKRREIGLRRALGARSLSITWHVLRPALIQLSLGLLAGAALTVAWGRAFQDYDRSSDPVVLLPSAAMVATVAVIACLVPVRRAAAVDPMAALRVE